MFPLWMVAGVSLAYVILLFIIANWGEKRYSRPGAGKEQAIVYTLSLGIYCTTWTFYGSVGAATVSGIEFLPIYLGPTIAALLFPLVTLKMLRITKAFAITSIADFIVNRYGQNGLIGGFVTLVAVIGGIPYIALQIKALTSSFNLITANEIESVIFTDTAFFLAIVLALFTIFFGTRHADATKQKRGLILAIAFESLVKLVTFMLVGIYVTYIMHDGFWDLTKKVVDAGSGDLLTVGESSVDYVEWASITFLSAAVFFVLPRQFQVAVLENTNEQHLNLAACLFPLYLFLITIFVLPIAFAGTLAGTTGSDMTILQLPLMENLQLLALMTYLGGFSAGTAMIIVACIALSTMISNDLVLPALLRLSGGTIQNKVPLSRLAVFIRRVAIIGLLALGYVYYHLLGTDTGLASLGLIAFTAAVQFAPAIFFGMYWRSANLTGVTIGMLAGVLVWFLTLIFPAMIDAGLISGSMKEQWPFGDALFDPTSLFGLTELSAVTHSLIWSLSVNIFFLIFGSLVVGQSTLERAQASLYVDILKKPAITRMAARSNVRVGELCLLIERVLGRDAAEQLLLWEAGSRGRVPDKLGYADTAFVKSAELLLARNFGAASSRAMISSYVRGEFLGADKVIEMLDETREVMGQNQELEQKSVELEKLSVSLRDANKRLEQLSQVKDDFLTTVSHELRTPLTSIRSFSEILSDDEMMDPEQRKEFLSIIIKETDRLTRLINDVLDLSKIESGAMNWIISDVEIKRLAEDAINSSYGLISAKNANVIKNLEDIQAFVSADRDRLLQVLLNLLSNATKFIPADDGLIRLSTSMHGSMVKIVVEDNGPGIAVSEREQVFSRYHQVATSLGGRPKGTGLGLTISKQITEHFSGKIYVEKSAALGGAAFIVELPLMSSSPSNRPEWPDY